MAPLQHPLTHGVTSGKKGGVLKALRIIHEYYVLFVRGESLYHNIMACTVVRNRRSISKCRVLPTLAGREWLAPTTTQAYLPPLTRCCYIQCNSTILSVKCNHHPGYPWQNPAMIACFLSLVTHTSRSFFRVPDQQQPPLMN